MDFPQLFQTTRDAGATGLLVVAVVGGFRRWYVWWWAYDAMVQDRNEWKSIALRSLHIAETVAPK